MSSAKITSVNADSLIQVTFCNGLEDPDFIITGLHVNGGGDEYAHVAFLRACAKLFNDKAESLGVEFDKTSEDG
tara:strand:- start:11628 stop:11849 length:222 start_codon:yes stop_codon:yes gene_type:complete